jgi:hypothetical protein
MKARLSPGIILSLLAGISLPVSISLYNPGFNGPIIYDSERVERAPHYGTQPSLSDLVRIFPQRPVAMFSFYVSYLFHGLNPPSLRIDNAALPALTALVLVAFLFANKEVSSNLGSSGSSPFSRTVGKTAQEICRIEAWIR